MIEILLVIAALLAVGLVGLAALILTPQLMTEFGLWTLLVGLLLGLPTGLWYHVVLYRLLACRAVLPERWWMDPVGLHARLRAPDFARIRPWFLLGGIGFLLSLVGGLAAIAGLLLTR